MPTKNSGLTCSALLRLELSAPQAERDRGEPRRLRLDVGLAEEEGEAGAEQHHGDADRDVVHPRQPADRAVHRAEQRAGDARGEHAEPRRAGVVGGRVGDHRAEHQRALEAEIDAARFFRQAFAERDEHERRRDADRAAEHGDEDGEIRRLVHVRLRLAGRLEDGEAAVERLGRQQHDEHQALQHQHRRVRQAHAPLDEAARGDDAAEQDRDRGMASGLCRARNATRMPVKP